MTVKKLVMLFVIGLMMTFSINAQDAAPRDVQDLVGARAAGGETQLRSRGYTFIKTDEGNDRKYSNWWKQSTRTCINVVTMNGRYDTILSVPAFDCNRGNNSGGNNDGNWGSVNPPSWARGTFYGTGPGGERITLTIDRNGSASARINNQSYSGNWSRGNHLIIAGGRSTVTRQGSSIVTTRVDNGERIVYSKTNSGGGYDPGSGSGGSNPPSWAQGTWYGTGPRGERITLVIGRDGNASANVNGGMSYGNWNRGNVLTIDGVRSNVRQQGGDIVTSTIGKNETIRYSRSGWSGATNPGGGYGDRVDLSDLVGDRASSAESQMRSRGFRNVDSFKTGNTAYTIWWRPVSRQCIQVAVANGRYDSVTDIGSHNRCR